ncbi:hypothetical protein [Micromonospora cathayae]|uniref:Uncharacterized protein n=1 Tax=Micromonospora cathayae TaxID=3028804 RepID=A0ABY7ZP89_9ACTN|nr:hypothetical protein [Micromonospora sp. HUAS 3]WDZ84845.1 hypothetical protein PVK37_31275 [Micromonospora sp. HUAS 3]
MFGEVHPTQPVTDRPVLVVDDLVVDHVDRSTGGVSGLSQKRNEGHPVTG